MSVAVFIFGFAAFNDRQVLVGVHTGPGAFYQLMPHNAMAALFGAALLYAIVALVMGVRAFWRDIGEPVGMTLDAKSLWQAIRDAGVATTLRCVKTPMQFCAHLSPNCAWR